MSVILQEFTPEKTILFTEKVRFHPELTFGEKVFLAEVQSMTSQGKYLSFSSRKLGKIFNVSNQTIINWVRKLNKMGLLEIDCDFDSPYNKIVIKSKETT